MKFNINKWHLIALGTFILISVWYFYPAIQGYVIKKSDISQFQGMAHEVLVNEELTGDNATWTNSMFGGMPSYLVHLKTKNSIVYQIYLFFIKVISRPISFLLVSFISFYILFVSLKVHPGLAIAGAILAGANTYYFLIIEGGHSTKAAALSFTPLILAGVFYVYDKKIWLGMLLTALGLGLQLTANHLQITYYTCFILGGIGIYQLIQHIQAKTIKEFARLSAFLVAAAGIAIMMRSTTLLLVSEYSSFSIRGKSELTDNKENKTDGLDRDYATAWSYGHGETFTLMIPGFVGGASGHDLGESSHLYEALINNRVPKNQAIQYSKSAPTYWGEQPFTGGPTYFGFATIFFFVLGFFINRKGMLYWVLPLTILSILLGQGHHNEGLTNFFLDYFPMYNKFRTVSMILVIANIIMPMYAMVTLHKLLFDESLDEKVKFDGLKFSLISLGGLLLLLLVFRDSMFDFSREADARFPEFFLDALIMDRKSMYSTGVGIAILYLLLYSGAIFAFIKGMLKKEYVMVVVGVLITLDMLGTGKQYLNNEKDSKGNYTDWQSKTEEKVPFVPRPGDIQILQAELQNNPELKQTIESQKKSLQKAADQSVSNAQTFALLGLNTNYRVYNNIGPTFMKEAQTSFFHKSLGGYHGAKNRRYQELVDKQVYTGNQEVINMLNTRYILQDGGKQARINPYANGNAWFVEEIAWVKNADEEMAALKGLDSKKKAVIDERFKDQVSIATPAKGSNAYVKMTKYAPEEISYEYENSGEGLIVFSEMYYAHEWNAYLDGQKMDKKMIRADYVLRGLEVPAGKHKLVVKFEPPKYALGNTLSLIGSILFLGILGLVVFKEYKNKTQVTQEAA